jgi:hypothetical protein
MHKLSYVLIALFGVSSHALIGGQPAAGFPEIVELRSGERVCTGTIVGKRAVLSAAHCANTESPYFRHLGKKYSVRYVKSKSADADLSLAITEGDIEGAQAMRIGASPKHGEPILLAGFGCTVKGGKPGGTLYAGLSRIVGMDQEHLLSAAKGGSVLCEGDSGGPALARENGQLRVVAVNSLGNLKNLNVNVRLDSKASLEFLREASRAHELGLTIPD